ncbi:hypothetical protein [Kribbella sp. NPDC049227]|uniref:hypothetical protein n=1 Tax=Kribbella sp. NPDC049227 TaxID=3364113 RepID=UPI00370F7E5E
MERVPQHVRRRIWRSRLYIDDVQEIVDLLGADSADVKISVPGYSTAGGADELRQFKNTTLHEIEIVRARPIYVSVDLLPNRGFIYGAEDDPTTVGLVNKVADILRPCRRWPSTIIFNTITFSVLSLGWSIFVLVLLASSPADVHWSAQKKLLLIASVLPILLLGGASFWIQLQRHTLIVCSRRFDAPTFWRRNKDSITLAIISTIIGALLGTVITIVVTKALG